MCSLIVRYLLYKNDRWPQIDQLVLVSLHDIPYSPNRWQKKERRCEIPYTGTVKPLSKPERRRGLNICTIYNAPQCNPVNTDTKGTCHTVRIIRVSVLSGLSEKTSGTHVLSI